jgi:type II secretory pathway predicted ATPase ExeA
MPFDRAQTQDYICAHLRYAGEEREIFTPSAVDAVFAYSGGIARKINKACYMGLLYAAQRNMRSIDGGSIEYVVQQELSW